MIPLVKLKREVEFNVELKSILNALKGIALNRFYALQRQLTVFDRFPALAGDILSGIPLENIDHPYVRPATQRPVVLMVTTDSGFMGSLNAQIVNAGIAEAGAEGYLAVIGEKGMGLIGDQRRETKLFPGIKEKTQSKLATEVCEFLLGKILSGECGRLIVVFPKPISLALQEVTVETVLPCSTWLATEKNTAAAQDVIWESEPKDMLAYVMTFWVENRLDSVFAMSRVSELAARVMHLEGSIQELTLQGKHLKHQYFKTRHAMIDRSMREVFASQLLLSEVNQMLAAEEESGGGPLP
ncbi:MAG TPA: FoF1 ATP synthase subunit gamma [Verrucomicrobiae bacterium]|nr:FoF1 ATP synthase subunit gamma [Verrucomicrobiae bacterium]